MLPPLAVNKLARAPVVLPKDNTLEDTAGCGIGGRDRTAGKPDLQKLRCGLGRGYLAVHRDAQLPRTSHNIGN